jgi:hypothetical protein
VNARTRTNAPPIMLPLAEAAAALGMGRTAFRERVAPELRVVRVGRCRLYPVAELERWADEHAARTLDR